MCQAKKQHILNSIYYTSKLYLCLFIIWLSCFVASLVSWLLKNIFVFVFVVTVVDVAAAGASVTGVLDFVDADDDVALLSRLLLIRSRLDRECLLR